MGFIGLRTCWFGLKFSDVQIYLRCGGSAMVARGSIGSLGSVNHCWETSIGFQQEKSVFRPPKHEDPALSHWKNHPHCNVMKRDGGL